MYSRQVRRVNLSLHLSPEHSRADLRAMKQLKKWHDALRQPDSDVTDVNMQMRRFHRDVYLAGLQLSLLKPTLCRHIAESLGREPLTLETLAGELLRDGLLPGGAAAPEKTGGEEMLAQLREEVAGLKALLEHQGAILARLAESGARVPTAEPSEIARGEEQGDSARAAPLEKLQKIRQKGIF